MLPLLPFIAGIAAGAAGAELWRRGNMPRRLGEAGRSLRKAASSGLDSVRQTGAALRESVSDTLQRRQAEPPPHRHRRRAGPVIDPTHPGDLMARRQPRHRARATTGHAPRPLRGRHRAPVAVPVGLARSRRRP